MSIKSELSKSSSLINPTDITSSQLITKYSNNPSLAKQTSPLNIDYKRVSRDFAC